MDEEFGSVHTYELDPDRWIAVEIERRWPKYVALWSIRRRSGDSDYPVAFGELEEMPPKDPADLDLVLDRLRDEARRTALASAAAQTAPEEQKRGFFSRVFGR
jgi:hypothetical protein